MALESTITTHGLPRPDNLAAARMAEDAVREAGASAKASGAAIYSIGLGDDVDEAMLREIASGEDHYLTAVDAAALEAFYNDLAKDLPCPGGVIWGH